MKIDLHTHLDVADPVLLEGFVDMCRQIQTQVCLYPVGSRCDHPNVANEQVLEAARQHPRWIIPFAFVDLWDVVNADEVTNFAKQGFRGLKCITPYYPYDHDLYMPLL